MATKKIDLSEWKLLGQFPKKEFAIVDVKKAMKKIEEQSYRERTCLHPDGCIIYLPDSRKKCAYCGRTQD
jgi:hypothetical protein